MNSNEQFKKNPEDLNKDENNQEIINTDQDPELGNIRTEDEITEDRKRLEKLVERGISKVNAEEALDLEKKIKNSKVTDKAKEDELREELRKIM